MSVNQARKIDLEKREIELKYIFPLRATFKHMGADAKNLYLATKAIPAQSLAKNYRPEFLKICRDAQRETIKKFGFEIRKNAEQKGFNFKVRKAEALIDYQIDTKDVEAVLNVSQVEKINNSFALDATMFVANESEEQADYITETNEKEISDAEKLAVILFFTEQNSITTKITDLKQKLSALEFQELVRGESPSILAAKIKKIREQINVAEKELAELIANKNKFIGREIEKKIIERGEARSELIASQNVGMAEAWARQKEAEIIKQNVPEIEIKKKWQAILDSRTRATHVVADGQEVGVDENFIVGGYPAKMPRDANLPPEESMNCRCVAIYSDQ